MTLEDHQQMRREGWRISLRREAIRLEPVRGGPFRNDEAVWLHVFDRAAEGCTNAIAALAMIEEFDPVEFAVIGRYVSIYRPSAVSNLRRAA